MKDNLFLNSPTSSTLKIIGYYCLMIICIVIIFLGGLIIYLESQLPPTEILKEAQLQVPLRIYTADHKLIAEFGEKRRIPVNITEVPDYLIKALIATEDARFYTHSGVDLKGLLRAAWILINRGSKSQGGSTITMQVARNFFLTRKKTYIRKLNEILLALKIEKELTKNEILTLYLNKIYLGQRAYGVAAAAQVYYGKTPLELTLAEAAVIAGLPKAPSKINPIYNPNSAKKRRNHVLARMLQYNYITPAAYQDALLQPITASYHGPEVEFEAPFVAEMARNLLLDKFGDTIYTKGYEVYTTINSKLQAAAQQSVKQAIINYDIRHGLHPVHFNIGKELPEDLTLWQQKLKKYPAYPKLTTAAITNIDLENKTINIISEEKQINNISLEHNKYLKSIYLTQILNNLNIGDIIYLENINSQWQITQYPEVEGALISLDPNNGKILALVGGYNFEQSNFNRVLQAQRLAGSTIKPFIFSAALNKQYTPASMFNDAPIVLTDNDTQEVWRPKNSSRKFYGPTRLRTALIKSRNLVSIRLLQELGIDYTYDFLTKFSFDKEYIPKSLSLALGTATVTPLELAESYAVLANGGFKIRAVLINKIIMSINDKIIYQEKPIYHCDYSNSNSSCNTTDNNQYNLAPQIISTQNSYLITDMLKDTINYGTGKRAKRLNRHDLSGKTGSTNDNFDAWFAGYNNKLLTVTWMGFDKPKSLKEYAASTALPMWIDFMGTALHNTPEANLPQPAGIITAKIDPDTGLLARPNQPNAIFEKFILNTAPKKYAPNPNNQILSKHNETINNKTIGIINTDDISVAEQLF